MRNSKIVGKIPKNRKSFKANNDEVLIFVRNGEIVSLIRGGGTHNLQHGDNTEWYFVDEGEHRYDHSYRAGNINFNFSLTARVAFPTLLINNKSLLENEMPEVVSNWAKSDNLSNIITDFLDKKSITDEKQMFTSNVCELLEREIMLVCREHFIKEWGMFLDKVEIKKKRLVSETSKKDDNQFNVYDHI